MDSEGTYAPLATTEITDRDSTPSVHLATNMTGSQPRDDLVSSQPNEPKAHPSFGYYHTSYVILITITINMLVWPWLLFAFAWSRSGLVASPSITTFVLANTQNISFLATLSGTIFAVISGVLFSTAIVRFSQKWIARRQEMDVFYISFFMTLKYQFFPWGIGDVPTIGNKWFLVMIVAACIFAFQFIPSGISALLTPTRFNKTEMLIGTELDFTSSAPDCISWLNAIQEIQEQCEWHVRIMSMITWFDDQFILYVDLS